MNLAIILLAEMVFCLSAFGKNSPSYLSCLKTNDEFITLQTAQPLKSDMCFQASFTATTPHPLDPSQGALIQNCEAVWTVNSCLMKIECLNDRMPTFRKPSTVGYQPADYDTEGNLIVWQPFEKFIVFTKDRNDLRDVQLIYKINPEGIIISTNSYTQIYRYPIGNHDGIYLFDQFCLAVGRGYSQYLKHVTSDETVENSTLHNITSIGNYGVSLTGQWTITSDNAADYLIREASFTMNGESKPSLVVSNSGLIIAKNFEIAQSGLFISGPYKAQYQVAFFKIAAPHSEIENAILEKLDSPTPAGSRTGDYRKNMSQ